MRSLTELARIKQVELMEYTANHIFDTVITITNPFPDLSNLSLVIYCCLLALDTSCELCGFDFENRKALASHARAHLRQLGIIEWKADGATSPIELLSELIRRDPAKVAAITRRYRMGDLYIKKVGCVFKICFRLFRFGRKQTSYKQY